MPYVKGKSGNPAGRPKGSRNRSTTAMQEALAKLVDANLENLTVWLNRIAVDDPKGAFQCMLSLIEFHMPKMSRITLPEESKDLPPEKDAMEQVDKWLAEIKMAIDEDLKNKTKAPLPTELPVLLRP